MRPCDAFGRVVSCRQVLLLLLKVMIMRRPGQASLIRRVVMATWRRQAVGGTGEVGYGCSLVRDDIETRHTRRSSPVDWHNYVSTSLMPLRYLTTTDAGLTSTSPRSAAAAADDSIINYVNNLSCRHHTAILFQLRRWVSHLSSSVLWSKHHQTD